MSIPVTPANTITYSKLPAWFKQPLPDPAKVPQMREMFRAGGLHTVCESAHCPNLGQCWGKGVATFMILGDICTRACRFCAIDAGRPLSVSPEEPAEVAKSVANLKLRYVVVTSVARDDLADEGAGQFAMTIRAIREINPHTKVEILIPDFSARPELLKVVVDAAPEVISHNVETVRRLSPKIRPQADYNRSLEVLKSLKELEPGLLTKTSLMVGLGETVEEITELMRDLRAIDCDMLTIGQYLSPSHEKRHLPVERFYAPEEFVQLKNLGKSFGFKHVMSAPMVRSSYIAEEGYRECQSLLEAASSSKGKI